MDGPSMFASALELGTLQKARFGQLAANVAKAFHRFGCTREFAVSARVAFVRRGVAHFPKTARPCGSAHMQANVSSVMSIRAWNATSPEAMESM